MASLAKSMPAWIQVTRMLLTVLFRWHVLTTVIQQQPQFFLTRFNHSNQCSRLQLFSCHGKQKIILVATFWEKSPIRRLHLLAVCFFPSLHLFVTEAVVHKVFGSSFLRKCSFYYSLPVWRLKDHVWRPCLFLTLFCLTLIGQQFAILVIYHEKN